MISFTNFIVPYECFPWKNSKYILCTKCDERDSETGMELCVYKTCVKSELESVRILNIIFKIKYTVRYK